MKLLGQRKRSLDRPPLVRSASTRDSAGVVSSDASSSFQNYAFIQGCTTARRTRTVQRDRCPVVVLRRLNVPALLVVSPIWDSERPDVRWDCAVFRAHARSGTSRPFANLADGVRATRSKLHDGEVTIALIAR